MRRSRRTTPRSSCPPTRPSTASPGQLAAQRRAPSPPVPGTAAALAAVGVPDVSHSRRRPTTAKACSRCRRSPSVRGKRIAIFRGEGGRDRLGGRVACARRAGRLRRLLPARAARSPAPTVSSRRCATGRAHALTVTSSEGLDNLLRAPRRPKRCTLLAARSRLRAASAHRGARTRELGFARVRHGQRRRGLVAGLLEWFAPQP